MSRHILGRNLSNVVQVKKHFLIKLNYANGTFKDTYWREATSMLFCHSPISSKSDLLNHGRSQTGENPFICNICDKAFSVKSNLMKHVKAHTVEKEKPFQCGNCENTFLDEIC